MEIFPYKYDSSYWRSYNIVFLFTVWFLLNELVSHQVFIVKLRMMKPGTNTNWKLIYSIVLSWFVIIIYTKMWNHGCQFFSWCLPSRALNSSPIGIIYVLIQAVLHFAIYRWTFCQWSVFLNVIQGILVWHPVCQ